MTPLEAFWNWFEENKAQYLFLAEVEREEQQRMSREFIEELRKLSPGVYFLIGIGKENEQELILTAEGNTEYFEDVNRIVAAAPQMDGWRIIAFKPALGKEFSVEYKGRGISAEKLFFRPLSTKADPKALGIRVAVPGYSDEEREQLLEVTYLLLDCFLGELSFAKDIQYVDVTGIPENLESSNFIELERLPEFIEWKNNRPMDA